MSHPYMCTPEAPWDKSKGTPVEHVGAKNVGECSESCCDYWECPNCGTHFKTEVAQ